MGLETGVVCRDCESFVHLSKLYFPTSWTDELIEEQFEPRGGQIQSTMAFMANHKSHNIALIDEYSPEWHDAITEYDRFEQ
jgi:hypothetical protein